MKNPTPKKKTDRSKFVHIVLILIIIGGFICTAASFTQAVTTSNNVVSRVVSHDKTIGYVRVGFVSMGITGLALIMFAFNTSIRNRKEKDRTDLMVAEVQELRKDINQLKKVKKSKKS